MPDRYPPGIAVEVLGRSLPVGEGRIALLLRIIYAPGAVIPPQTDPGTGVWVIESGAIDVAVEVGEAQVTRAGAPPERLGPGAEVVLVRGDAVSYGPDTSHASRNPGEAPATILVAGVYAGEPLLRPATAPAS